MTVRIQPNNEGRHSYLQLVQLSLTIPAHPSHFNLNLYERLSSGVTKMGENLRATERRVALGFALPLI